MEVFYAKAPRALVPFLALSLIALVCVNTFASSKKNSFDGAAYESERRTPIYNGAEAGQIDATTRKRMLGRAGWYFIHSTAAQWSLERDPDGASAKMFLQAIADLYPCEECRSHFEAYLSSNPPKLESGLTFLRWTCEAHNDVNRRNKSPLFDCTNSTRLQEMYGDCGCDT
mmetsp:Transcript_9754/g.26004  ORF Transcript_9754/g.26004 Transcript_9754/m.26004 type:complete len:171 (+) Transcript_9754:942-1454(+)